MEYYGFEIQECAFDIQTVEFQMPISVSASQMF